MKIKSFMDFINEVSGTELVGPVGPAYGDTKLQNKTVSSHDTNIVYSDIDDKFYSEDDYNQLYNDYLKSGGKPLDGFNKENIDIILTHLQSDSI